MLTGGIAQHGGMLFVPVSAFGVTLARNPEYECCKSHGAVRALDAATGEILWTTRMTPLAEKTYESEAGTRMWGPSGAAVWTTPTIDAQRGRIYVGTGENTSTPATDLSDAIVALDMATPECSFFYGLSAAASATAELAFAGSLDGTAYAFSLADGAVLWTYDTVREYESVNGVDAHGGAIDNAGIQVAGDIVFVQSGYARFGQMPGNVLLAFRLPQG